MNFHVYTDGACKGNPGKGGYAYIVYDDMNEIWVKSSGSEIDTTNNRMELVAVIEALRTIYKMYQNYTIKVYSDSAYIVNCFNDSWIDKWKENGWKTSKKESVANRELWEILDELVNNTGATFERISRKDFRMCEVDKNARIASKS